MEGSIALAPGQRKRLLGLYRKPWSPHHVRLRAHIVLLLADGHTWAVVAAVLFCSTATIARWKDRFEGGGIAALFADDRGRWPALGGWAALAARWVRGRTPRDFGYLRSRWCCLTVWVSQETVRRWLLRDGLVWRRPRPVLGPKDPRRPQKLRAIRDLLRSLPADEAAVFQDEVDLNLNPDIGCMWMAEWGHRVVLHYLPAYSPTDNPVERVWWHLREQVTRNHRCRTIGELTDLTLAWIEQHDRGRFKIEGAMYERLKKAAA
jgi:transposase